MTRMNRWGSRLALHAGPSPWRFTPNSKALGIMGAAVEARLDSGQSVGSVSGHLYQSLPRAVRSRFVVPPDVLGIADYDLKYLVILRLALGEPHITYLGSPNPSTFLRLLNILNDRRDMLLRSLETGRLDELEKHMKDGWEKATSKLNEWLKGNDDHADQR